MPRKTSLKVLFPLFISVFLGTSEVIAQDLHVYYDAQDATLRYEIDGKEVKRPKVKKNANIFLHVENYNNYLYEVEMQTNNQTIEIANGNGLGSIMGMVGNPMNLLNPGNFDSGAGNMDWAPIDTGFIDINDILDDQGSGHVSQPTNYSSITQQSAAALRAINTMQDMAAIEKQFSAIEEDIENVVQRKEIRTIVMQEVQKIKRNDQLPPDQIKRIAMEFLGNVLDPGEQDETLKLSDVLNKGSDRSYLKTKLSELEEAKQAYIDLANELEYTGIELQNVGSAASNIKTLSAVITVNTKVPTVLASVENEVSTIKSLYQDAAKSDIQNLTSIWYEYEALASNDFSHTYRTEALGDRTSIDLNFYKVDTMGNRIPSTKKDPMHLKVPVYGGMKVNISVGLNFAQFFNVPQDYFLKDTIVSSEDANEFLPMATSFIHFYPQKINEVALGGSFGVGVPLGGDDNISSLNFFIGPSLILGRSKRVILNTGLMGGRVRTISQGVKVGDVLPPFAAIPTKSTYRMGYYLGISFNI